MMRVAQELALCECCALVVANDDDSGCRDYYGHTHKSAELPFHTSVGDDDVSSYGFTCDGCGEEQGAYATRFKGIVLEVVPAR